MKKNFILLLTVFISLFLYCSATRTTNKILIVTYVYNKPAYIETHVKTFRAFLQDSEWEYVVFNDASDNHMCGQIEQTCNRLGVRCFRVPQHLHANSGRTSAGHRHMDSIRYSYEQIVLNHDGIVLMVDADMFLIKPFCIAEYVKRYDLMGWEQRRANPSTEARYIAPTLIFMDLRTLPNKHTISCEGGYINGLPCDVGAHWHYYLNNNPTARVKFFVTDPQEVVNALPKDREFLHNCGFDDLATQFILSMNKQYCFEFHGDRNFVHYLAGGSNWQNKPQSYLQEKDALLNAFIDASIQYYRS